MPPVLLSPHPSTPSPNVCSIAVAFDACEGGLMLSYLLAGEIDALCVPAPVQAQRADGLWQDTCFEAFLKGPDAQAGYYEFNFSPTGAWACYRFGAYREGMAVAESVAAPRMRLRHTASRLCLDVYVRLDGLPTLFGATSLRLGLAAVVKQQNGGISYWAYAHPAGKPDFHHADGFALELALADKFRRIP